MPNCHFLFQCRQGNAREGLNCMCVVYTNANLTCDVIIKLNSSLNLGWGQARDSLFYPPGRRCERPDDLIPQLRPSHPFRLPSTLPRLPYLHLPTSAEGNTESPPVPTLENSQDPGGLSPNQASYPNSLVLP